MSEKVHTLESVDARTVVVERPVLLYESEGHAIYWLGVSEETVFRCNVYLIKAGEEGFLVDPGGKQAFDHIRQRVAAIMQPEHIVGMILCHQDPDVAGSMVDWLAVNPAMQVISTPRTHVLLPYYGQREYEAYDVEQAPRLSLSSGGELIFYPAPFLHFPGAFVTYDTASGYLFSGDIWAALDMDWKLVVSTFEEHTPKMDLFHKDYMPSGIAARGFVHSLSGLDIRAILPQHGSLISQRHVANAMQYLERLECGLDLIYADSALPTKEMGEQYSEVVADEPVSQAIFSFDTETAEPCEETLQREATQLREALQQASRLAALRDRAVHDLRLAEHRLKESQARLSDAQQLAHVGHWDWNIVDNTLYWSDEIYRIFGLKPQEFGATYEAFLERVHPDDRERVKLGVKQALDGEKAYSIEHQIIQPDGTVRSVHEQARITLDEEGQPARMLGTVQDITERKRTEALLQRNHRLIQSIERLQSTFISEGDPFQMYDDLLDDLIALSESEYGFIGEVLEDADGSPYLKLYALTNLAWNEESQKLYEAVREKGFEFRSLDNLIGHVIQSGEPVVSNDPMHDPRRGGLPDGHPPVDAFAGIPVHYGERLVGVVGLANREGGYEQTCLDYMGPMASACGQIIVARQDQVARRIAEESLARMATMDGLLGIPNRRHLDEYLQQEWRRARRNGTPLSVIMIDIDHFKLYNDHYGHQAGDDCLKQVAGVLKRGMRRPADMVARYGGEEFVCVLPDTSLVGAEVVAREVQHILKEEAIPHAASPVAMQVTLSMGIAATIPAADSNTDALLSRADNHLYLAKSEGRDRFVSESSEGR